jgi:hypothetical protein
MDAQQILIISLRNFLNTGEKLLANLDDSKLTFEFLDNALKIRKYIFEGFYHNSILRAYNKDFPSINPAEFAKNGETIMEKIANSNEKIRAIIELFGITLSPEREKQRDQLMLLVSTLNKKTRAVLEQINKAT